MKTFKELREVTKSTGQLKDACWSGYTAVGTKMKGGRKVPNCVPEEVELDDEFEAMVMELTEEEFNSLLDHLDYQDEELDEEKSPAWQRKEGQDPKGGLNRKGVASYRREHPGSKLSTAVTTKPSKLKKGSKPWNRRKSFCARMSGMKSRLTSAKTANDPDSRINKSLRKWNC